MLNRIFSHWKSSLIGLSVLALAIDRGIHWDSLGHLAMTPKDWFGIAMGVLTAGVGMASQDAGTVTVDKGSGPEAVAGHEMPDDSSLEKDVVRQ